MQIRQFAKVLVRCLVNSVDVEDWKNIFSLLINIYSDLERLSKYMGVRLSKYWGYAIRSYYILIIRSMAY